MKRLLGAVHAARFVGRQIGPSRWPDKICRLTRQACTSALTVAAFVYKPVHVRRRFFLCQPTQTAVGPTGMLIADINSVDRPTLPTGGGRPLQRHGSSLPSLASTSRAVLCRSRGMPPPGVAWSTALLL